MRTLVITVVVVGVLAALWFRKRPAAAPAANPSVLVITLDTFRADAVGDDTPALLDFLKQARRFSGARTVTPLTVPAHTSLFTGLEPAAHGVHDNASALLHSRREFPLLAEEFRKAGYATRAFVAASVLGVHTGLDAGFDTYIDVTRGDDVPYAPAGRVLAEALPWLAQQKAAAPFFAWVHLFDAHDPAHPFPGDARRPATPRNAALRGQYAGEVRRVDAAVERLLAAVPRDTIVVIVSDHGEGLEEHGEPTHGPLCYGTTIDIVLAVRVSDLESGVDSAPRSICDVAPALRVWCGLPAQDADGVSLAAATRPIVVSESLMVWRIHGWGQVLAAFDGRYTLVESGASIELFDRAEDPGEVRPLDLTGHVAYERLDRALQAYRTRGGDQPAYMPGSITPYGTGRRPGGTYLSRPDNAKQVDPRTRLKYWARVEGAKYIAKTALARGDERMLHQLIEDLGRLAKEDPGNPAPHWARAGVLRTMAELTRNPTWRRDAAAAVRAAIERGYLSAAVVTRLIEDSHEGGDRDGMKAAIRVAADENIVPDLAFAAAVARTCRFLAGYGDKEALAQGRAVVARARRHHPDAGERLDALDRLLK